MSLTRNVIIATLMTLVTTLLFGVIYPLVVTGLAQAIFPDRANGQLIERNGRLIGSRIIGQSFSSPAYFHGRRSARQRAAAEPGARRAVSAIVPMSPTMAMATPAQPSPDALLARLTDRDRPRLRIYIGAAPGVGKTYAMLQEAHALRARGLNAVVGYVETYGRRDTEAQLRDLEIVPRRIIEYRRGEREEM